jgi:hypothetical protein
MDQEKKEKTVSRQRLWQIKMREEGRCSICGDEAYRRGYCQPHYEKKQAKNLLYQRMNPKRKQVLQKVG